MNAITDKIVVHEKDYQRLLSLIDNNPSPAAEALDEELSRAEVVAEKPRDVVMMNSRVTFSDLDTGNETTVTLVFPREANVDQMKISVLSPVGSALIGLPIGGTIDWPMGSGKVRRLKVVAVTVPED